MILLAHQLGHKVTTTAAAAVTLSGRPHESGTWSMRWRRRQHFGVLMALSLVLWR